VTKPQRNERKATLDRVKGRVKRIPLTEYHVVPNGRRWDIERDDAFIGSFDYDLNTAIGLAVERAQRDLHNGLDAMVCVQEPDGHCRKVWP
jgi:hypothetical protein